MRRWGLWGIDIISIFLVPAIPARVRCLGQSVLESLPYCYPRGTVLVPSGTRNNLVQSAVVMVR